MCFKLSSENGMLDASSPYQTQRVIVSSPINYGANTICPSINSLGPSDIYLRQEIIIINMNICVPLFVEIHVSL